jgi:serine/threonine-protein kinase RsbW
MTSPPDRPVDRPSSSSAGIGQHAMEGEKDAAGAGPRQGMDLSELAPGTRWRRVFPGEERQLGLLRRWLASVLPACPSRDDVIGVANELASNAVRHTASGRGGKFAVEIAWHRTAVRVAVADGGGPAEPRLVDDPVAEHGRGLLLVHGLSLRAGVIGDQQGRLVWAEISWNAPDAVARESVLDLYEGAIRDGEAMLAHCFGDVPTWFGHSTLEWWALPRPDVLVSAPSARELAGLLYRLLDAPAA